MTQTERRLAWLAVVLLAGCTTATHDPGPSPGVVLRSLHAQAERSEREIQELQQQGARAHEELEQLLRRRAVDGQRDTDRLLERLDRLSATLASLMARTESWQRRADQGATREDLQALSGAVASLTARVDELGARLEHRVETAKAQSPSPEVAAPVPAAPRPGAAPGGTPPSAEVAALVPGDPRPGTESGPADLYGAAYLDFSRGNYALAIGGFGEFLRRHPDDAKADNAQYWIGEAYLALAHRYQDGGAVERAARALKDAADAFHQVAERYPGGDKTPAALHQEALVLLELQEPSLARTRLEYLIEKFPAAHEARLARERIEKPQER